MLVYAGIDEAGYGPIFGPLVIVRSVFILDGAEPYPPPSLWKVLSTSICRRPQDSRGRIAINDSKALYTPVQGLAHFERGVLAFLDLVDLRPARLDELLHQLSCDEPSCRTEHPCYADAGGWPPVPVDLEGRAIEAARRRLRRCAEGAGLRLAEVKAAVLLEDRFNRELAAAGNKALAAWTFVAGHLRSIWEDFGEHEPYVVVDRQGGRIYYLQLLADLFPQARLCILRETAPVSEYELSEGGRRMRIRVQVESERDHLPAALASMAAKYVRELLLMRFQRFWREQAPHVRPTYGYYGDGRRFLREIEPLLERLNLDRDLLVRRS
jgi:hypothetical protein